MLAVLDLATQRDIVLGTDQQILPGSAFIIATAETALPQSDPNKASLQKAAAAVEGWSYLRGGDLGKFNELAASYAAKYTVAREEFKEPTSLMQHLSSDAELLPE